MQVPRLRALERIREVRLLRGCRPRRIGLGSRRPFRAEQILEQVREEGGDVVGARAGSARRGTRLHGLPRLLRQCPEVVAGAAAADVRDVVVGTAFVSLLLSLVLFGERGLQQFSNH